MRVLLVSRAALVASYRPKLAAIAAHDDVELTAVVPPTWREPGRVQRREPGPTPGYELVTERILANGSFHLHCYPSIGRLFRRLRPDVVQIEEEPYNLATWQLLRLARRHGARVVCVAWQNIDRRYPPPFSRFERDVLRGIDHLVCGSRESVDVWRAKGYRGPASIVPIGLDPDAWRPAAAREDRPFTVGYIGRFVPEKGVDLLVDAFARVPGDARLVLSGEGPQRDELLARVERSPARDRITVEGWVASDAVAERMRGFDVVAVPSLTRPNWKEQFGRVLIESMALGVPVVGSSSGEIPEVLGAAGVIVPEGDAAALGDAIAALVDDPTRRAELARHGRDRVTANYTWARVGAQSVDVFRSVLASTATGSASPRRPRVTVVAHEVHHHGGMEVAMAELLARAADRYDITVVSAHVEPALRGAVRWWRVPTPPKPAAVRFLVFGALAAPLVALRRRDLVHTLGAIVPNRADLVTVQYCHAGVPEDARTASPGVGRVQRWNGAVAHATSVAAERWCYRPGRVRRFAAVSPGVGDEVAAAYPGIPVSVTPNGVDTDRFAPDDVGRATVRAELGAGDADTVALFVGGDWARKGLAVAIEALGRAVADGAAVRLWVVGRGDTDRYRAIARDAAVDDRVTFLGFRADRERYFQGADVFVLPTRYETFCIAAFEAAAVGIPLVMPPVNDVGALVRDGTGGVLVGPDDVAATAAALLGYASDPERRATDGAAARARAASFTWTASARSVLDQYRQLLESRP